MFCCLRRPDVILFVLLPVRILDGDGSPLPDRLNDSRFDECIGLNSTADSETLSVQGQGAIEEALLCREGIRALRVLRRITWCQPD